MIRLYIANRLYLDLIGPYLPKYNLAARYVKQESAVEVWKPGSWKPVGLAELTEACIRVD